MQIIRVLLVDDDYDYYTLINRMLTQAEPSMKVDWAGNYEAAMNSMLRAEHDIYLVDYYLGNKDGLELLRAAVAKGITAPIIMITGHEYDSDLQSLQAGAADYIVKSDVTIDMLMRSLRYALERTHVVQELRDSEERYRNLVEEAFEGILITNLTGKITFANKKMVEIVGQTEEPLDGMNVRELIVTLKDGRDFPPPNEGSLSEQQLKTGAGRLLDVEVSAKQINGDHLQYIVRDVTERKAAIMQRDRNIERLQILHQVDDELSQMLNIDYVLAMALDATVRLSGANAGFIGILDNNQIKLARAIGHYTETPKDEYLPEMPLLRRLLDGSHGLLLKDVTQEPLYVSTSPNTRAQMMLPMTSYERVVGVLVLETNKPERFTEETFDFLKLITQRVAVAVENAQLYQISQDQLNKLQELYEQVSNLERLKTDMIRMASHDLRNPVGVILGYTELLRRILPKEGMEKPREYVESIDKAARRMKKITADILSLERIEKMNTDSGAQMSLRDVVRDTFEEFRDQAQAKKQTYAMGEMAQTYTVRGDSAQIREAIANLITNAIKYTPAEGSIRISLEQVDDNVVFKVIDNGYGIPEDQQVNLFKPFFRAYSDETADIEGTGLGLHLIKNIVERHQGFIVFESTYGTGSTFGFSLPLVMDEARQES
ncbi:MAG: hypothetical protein OHK0046_44020 [Anaerolineae bacterium]